jgi:hypothetical protein
LVKSPTFGSRYYVLGHHLTAVLGHVIRAKQLLARGRVSCAG